MNKITNFTKISYVFLLFMLSVAGAWAQCNAPTDVTISSVTTVSAQVSWTTAFPVPANGYLIEVRTSGLPGDGGPGLKVSYEASSSATSETIGDLDPSTAYSVYIKSLCISPPESTYTPAVTFTTAALAGVVAITASNPTNNSFTAKWQPLAGANNYQILYSKNPGFGNPNYSSFAGNVTARLIINLDQEATYYYKVRGRKNNGAWGPYGNAISVTTTAVAPAQAIWENGEWTAEPTVAKDVIIRDDYNSGVDQFGSSLQAKSLTVDAGNVFTLASGTYARVNTTIVNNAGAENFVVETNANLYQYSTLPNNTPITVKRESFPIYKLDYTMWSSPVSGQNLLAFSPATLLNRFYSYDVGANSFNTIANPAAETFEAARGYLIRAPNNWPVVSATPATRFTGVFTGIPNNGPVSVAVSEGYNMIGNPYPTDIAADGLLGMNTDVNVSTLYFWRRRNAPTAASSTSYYATFTEFAATVPTADVPEPDGIIKPGQGFIVDAKFNAPTEGFVKFNRDVKVEDIYSNNFYKTSEPIERHKLWLNLTAEDGIFSQIAMGFASNALDGLDRNDGKSIDDGGVALSSLLEGNAYNIQAKSLPFENTTEFPLRMRSDIAGNFTITLSKVFGMFDGLVDPLLVDSVTNTTTNLSNGAYTFTTEAGTFDTRFKIVFVETALGTVDNAIDGNAVIAIKNSGVLNISAGSYTINSVEVYDLQGRRIYTTQNVDASTTSISNLNAQQQIILVKIGTDHGTVTKKVQF